MIALFPDGPPAIISAQDSRDLIVSAFGYIAAVQPTVNNDSVDTAAIGATFDTGSRWTDTTHNTVWFCVIGTPGAAVWKSILVPALVPAGTYGDAAHYIALVIDPFGQISNLNLFPIAGATPAFSGASLTSSSFQALVIGSNNTVLFHAHPVDQGGYWFVGNPSRITIPTLGYYRLDVDLTIALNPAGGNVTVSLYQNGVATGISFAVIPNPSFGTVRAYFSDIVQLSAGVYLEWVISGLSGLTATLTLAGAEIEFLGP
jgi:hypothetical protein